MKNQTKLKNIGIDAWISSSCVVVLSFFLIYWLLTYSFWVSSLLTVVFAGVVYTNLKISQLKNELIDTKIQLEKLSQKTQEFDS